MRMRSSVAASLSLAMFAAALLAGACVRLPPSGGGGTSTTTASTTTSSTTAVPGGGAAIGPNQRFVGLVNGTNQGAVVYVVCGGPILAGSTGPPAGGQTVEVRQVASGGGNTGSIANGLWAEFGADLFHSVAFTSYDAPGSIPGSLRLPCEGTGTIGFTSCFGTRPCAADAVDDVVTVTFVNIAV
jgi:hypothetical protein